MSQEAKSSDRPLVDQFHNLIHDAIRDDGIYPHQLVMLQTGGAVERHQLMFNSDEALMQAMCKWATGRYSELIIGIDHYANQGQGRELSGVVIAFHMQQGLRFPQIGIIEYRCHPRFVKPWDWSNSYWKKRAATQWMEISKRRTDLEERKCR